MPSNERDFRHAPAIDACEKPALIIEDLPIIAMSIQDELAELGFSSAIASTEAEAVALAEDHCPDLNHSRCEACGRVWHRRGAAHLSRSTNRGDLHDRRFRAGGGGDWPSGRIAKAFHQFRPAIEDRYSRPHVRQQVLTRSSLR